MPAAANAIILTYEAAIKEGRLGKLKAAVTAIYYRLPSEQEAAAAGFSVEDYALRT